MSRRQFSTPMMQQYVQLKQQYADCILLFRLGDFYELFLEDAQIGAQVLGITLTARPRGKDGEVPMAGVPYHSAQSYISKLIRAGHKVAICEQVSQPDNKGIVDRQVVRIITPGTITDETDLDHKINNYLLIIHQLDNHLSLVFAELTTGEIAITETHKARLAERLGQEICRFQPAEVLHDPKLDESIIKQIDYHHQGRRYSWGQWPQSLHQPKRFLKKVLPTNQLKQLPTRTARMHYQTLAVLFRYLDHTQQQLVKHLTSLRFFTNQDSLALDPATLDNLEVFTTLREGETQGSLVSELDHTQTAMGGRLLRRWLRQPLNHIEQIQSRLDAVDFFRTQPRLLAKLRSQLSHVGDLERVVARLNLHQGNPKDLLRLQSGLEQIETVRQTLKSATPKYVSDLSQNLDQNLSQLCGQIEQTLQKTVPVDPKKGNFIQTGVNHKLDQIRQTIKSSQDWIARAQEIERKRTGIASLKIKFNKVFGYYIEVSKANLDQVPNEYERKQTLVNSERFITPELKHHEEIILSHQSKAEALELKLFNQLLESVIQHTQALQTAASAIGQLDCLTNLAYVALERAYTRPQLHKDYHLKLTQSRHPTVEQLLPEKTFVPNDVALDSKQSTLIITGPNMAGKSVFMRQVALITLMAHIGSFVPAEVAEVGLVDRIFVRSGAGDAIGQGLSTFMVEMVETAQILHRATDKSLVIMDEIGRGTTTYDGISIAWAVAEHLAKEIQAKSLFATHYHELQNLEDEYPEKIKNYHAAVELHQGEPVFMYRILEGKAQASYGVAVAKMAGVPDQVATQANKMLKTLESQHNLEEVQSDMPFRLTHETHLSTSETKLLEKLKQINVAKTTPLEALNLLAELQKQLDD